MEKKLELVKNEEKKLTKEEAIALLREEQNASLQAFNDELQVLLQKYNVRLDITHNIQIIPAG